MQNIVFSKNDRIQMDGNECENTMNKNELKNEKRIKSMALRPVKCGKIAAEWRQRNYSNKKKDAEAIKSMEKHKLLNTKFKWTANDEKWNAK